MAQEQLFEFGHDGKTIKVFKGDGSSYVYYSKNGGSSISTGLRYNEKQGSFTSGSGASVAWADAKSYVRSKL